MKKKLSLAPKPNPKDQSTSRAAFPGQQNDFKQKISKNTEKDAVTTVLSAPGYLFGNRPDYYAHRGVQLEVLDARVVSLDSSFIYNKRVLDLGCHSGVLTLQIAKSYHPKLIKGLDLDYRLINLAVKNWSSEERVAEAEREAKIGKNEVLNHQIEKMREFPENIKQKHPELANLLGKRGVSSEGEKSMSIETENPYPHNVQFEVCNVITDVESNSFRGSPYDTILCFSLTKWIHLNYGDEGVKTLFKNIKNSLVQGGTLLLEIQKYKSYAKKIREYPSLKAVYQNIQFLPESFDEYLTQQLGFTRVDTLESKRAENFKRDIVVYKLGN